MLEFNKVKRDLNLQSLLIYWESVFEGGCHPFFGSKAEIENSVSFKTYSHASFTCEKLSEARLQEAIAAIRAHLEGDLKKSGTHRAKDWIAGWGENLKNYELSGKKDDLFPKYFSKYPFVRIGGDLFEVGQQNVETIFLAFLVDLAVEVAIKSQVIDSIYEFGCGTGHHLIRLRENYPQIKLTGLDWAETSQRILEKVAIETQDSKLFSKNFDYFEPDFSMDIDTDSLVLTVASLEQIGDKHSDFVGFLLEKKPKIIINIEPIEELLINGDVLAQLSTAYFKKRNYLSGYFTALTNLQDQGRIEILSSSRSFFGSFFIEGYSMIVWRVVD
jgi:SAM-dependent methyltransferase